LERNGTNKETDNSRPRTDIVTGRSPVAGARRRPNPWRNYRFFALRSIISVPFSSDVTVRMRAADALEKISRTRIDLFEDHTSRLLTDVSETRQASVQWHLAQILPRLSLTARERARAIAICVGTSTPTRIGLLSIRVWKRSQSSPLTADACGGIFSPSSNAHIGSKHKLVATRARKLLSRLETS
jgi:hypothetical protein